MANWQRKVDLSAYTEQYDKSELSVQEFAKIVAEKLKSLQKFEVGNLDDQLRQIIYGFLDLASEQDDAYAEGDFDCLLEELYDWGDISLDNRFGGKKVCWIKMR